MNGHTDQGLEVGRLTATLWRRGRVSVAVAGTVALIWAIVLLLSPRRFEGTMVLVPVQGAHASAGLAGAASLLGGSLELGATGFEATRDVVAYLLRSRTVLLAAAGTPYLGRPLSEPIVHRAPSIGNEELLLGELRHVLRVTSSKETGFVTVSVQARDSGAVRAFLGATVSQTQRVFAEVAQAQARELLRAQERRLDSANAELRRAEDQLLRFDEGNRLLTPRTRLSLERARLERGVTDAGRVYEQVTADRQSAIARELEEAPAIALVERLPGAMPPKPKRIFFRSLLLGLAVLGAGFLLWATRELVRSSMAPEGPGA